MSTITVSTSFDYSALAVIDVSLINFTNTDLRVLVTAKFAATQFDNIHILDDVTINGSTGRNRIEVGGAVVEGATWQFTNWSANDVVLINGTHNADLLGGTMVGDRINGGSGEDEILGGLGRDILDGGAQNDTFRYQSAAELVNGESIDGGTGTGDLIVLEGDSNTTYKFQKCTVVNVEVIQFEGGAQVELDASQVGAGGVTEFISNLQVNMVTIIGQTVSTAGLAFTSWTDGEDRIVVKAQDGVDSVLTGGGLQELFYGSSGQDTISGMGGNDIIIGGAGMDTLSGGDGDDIISYGSSSDIVTGETADGGDGFDTVSISRGGTHHVWELELTSMERLSFGFLAPTIEVSGDQIGGQAGLINVVSGNIATDKLVVLGPVVDLSGVSFTNWSQNDTVTIKGAFGQDNLLTGSVKSDTIYGGGQNDVINGGKGVDTIVGWTGKDIMTGGNQTDYFMFLDVSDSVVGAERDRITDFSVNNDIIDLSNIDAIAGGSDDAFVFMGEGAFDGAGQIRIIYTGGGNTIIRGNIDNDPGADFEIALNGTLALTADDFFL